MLLGINRGDEMGSTLSTANKYLLTNISLFTIGEGGEVNVALFCNTLCSN